jgi:hypothetical protein
MILLSTALALVSAGGIVGAPAWADAFGRVCSLDIRGGLCRRKLTFEMMHYQR